MIDVEETEKGLRVVDAAKNEVEVKLVDWTPGGEAMEIDRDVEVTITGRVSEIRLIGKGVTIESASRERLHWVQFDEKIALPADEHLVHGDAIIPTYIRLDSEFTIFAESIDDYVTITLPKESTVTVGFRSHVGAPTQRLHIPPTPEGVANALSTFSNVHKTDTPDRSYPSMRAHPPILEIDDDAAIDGQLEPIEKATIILRMPRSLRSLFVIAPLVFYLGAAVKLESREAPLLETESIEYQFTDLNRFPEDIARLLSRVFYLDCLVRNAGPYGFDIHELDYLNEVVLDLERLYPLPTSERLAEYLEVPFERIADGFPEWPMAVSLETTVDNIPTLPHLLDRLSLIFPPASTPVDERTIVARSLGDFHRSATCGGREGRGEVTDIIEPVTSRGAVHGWIADGTPIDAFKCLPEAFSNRLEYLGQSGPPSVVVILNDAEMDAEFSQVATTYRRAAETCSMEVEVLKRLGTDELATTFEGSYDFVHYIGHCDLEGLRCHDGNLPTSSLSEINVQSFFLNACQSYDEGLELIRRGSVSGAVTIGDVLDNQARKVGTTFARILGRGYNIQRSLKLARARAIMNRQYGIVGDGTHTLIHGRSHIPPILYVSNVCRSEYKIFSDSCPPNFQGSLTWLHTYSKPVITGNDNSHSVSAERFERHLHTADEPIIYEGKLYWPDELLDELF